MKKRENSLLIYEEVGTPDKTEALPLGAGCFFETPVNDNDLRARNRSMQKIKTEYEELQNLLRLREVLSNMVVHDLRCYLTNIILGLECLEYRNNIDKSDIELVRNIRLSAGELDCLTENLLLMAKQRAGKLTLNYSDVDVLTLIEEVGDCLRNYTDSKNIKLNLGFSKDSSRTVSIDKDLFKRLIENLVTNAIKYSPPQSTVKIRLKNPESEAKILLQVIDEGEGIPGKYHDTIFEEYVIAEMSEKGVRQIGLGLSFCKMVAQLHGGRIYVLDNKPKGSIFCVEL